MIIIVSHELLWKYYPHEKTWFTSINHRENHWKCLQEIPIISQKMSHDFLSLSPLSALTIMKSPVFSHDFPQMAERQVLAGCRQGLDRRPHRDPGESRLGQVVQKMGKIRQPMTDPVVFDDGIYPFPFFDGIYYICNIHVYIMWYFITQLYDIMMGY